MKRDNINYGLVGAFVVAMGIAFILFMYAVTGRTGPSDSYFVVYQNVSGLKFGTGVFYEGYHVGQVESIAPESSAEGMQYRLELSVASGWKIPRDSIAKVQSSGLISAVSIHIREGDAGEFLAPGDLIDGQGQTDIFSVLNQAAGDLRNLSQEGLLPVLKNANERVSELSEEILRFRREDLSPFLQMLHTKVEGELVPETTELLSNLDNTVDSMNAMLSPENQHKVGSILLHVDDAVVNLDQLVSRIETTRQQMNGVLESVGTLVSENQDSLGQTVVSAQDSVAELEVALRTVNQHLGNIMLNVESTSRHMNEFARSVRDNPSRLIRSSAASEPGRQR